MRPRNQMLHWPSKRQKDEYVLQQLQTIYEKVNINEYIAIKQSQVR
jgi:hypothetical protein